jgi:hypothetical protein
MFPENRSSFLSPGRNKSLGGKGVQFEADPRRSVARTGSPLELPLGLASPPEPIA